MITTITDPRINAAMKAAEFDADDIDVYCPHGSKINTVPLSDAVLLVGAGSAYRISTQDIVYLQCACNTITV